MPTLFSDFTPWVEAPTKLEVGDALSQNIDEMESRIFRGKIQTG